MAVEKLPKTITKDILFEEAQRRFQSWAKMYGDPNVSAQYMYEDMSASCYCGCPADDFQEIVGPKKEEPIRYQYKDGSCSFIVDGIEVMVLDLRDMRKDPVFGAARYADICIPVIHYDDGDIRMDHPIPNAWLYGSTSEEFEEGMPVHKEFLDAAREYIKKHNITKEMQEVQD